MTHHIDLSTITLTKGSHPTREDGVCVMELVAWLADDPHSDMPSCSSRWLSRAAQRLNDTLDDEQRQQLKDLAPRLIGTAGGDAAYIRRWANRPWTVEVLADVLDSDLRYSNLRGSDLRGSDLSDSDLRCSNLSDSDLSGSDLSGSDLSGSDLSGSDLRGSDLRCSDLRGSDLRGSDLRGSDLRGSDLSDSEYNARTKAPAGVDLTARGAKPA